MEEKKTLNFLGWGLIAMILFNIVSGSLLIKLFPAIFTTAISQILANYVGMYGIGLPVLLWLTRQQPQATIKSKEPLKFSVLIKFYMMSLSGMYLVNMVYNGFIYVISGNNGNAIGDVINQLTALDIFLVVVLFAPIIEELIFRQLLYKLVAPYGRKSYLFISSLMFALFHLNLGQGLYAFWLGLLFAIIFERTGNIFYTIGLHMIINFTGSFAPLLAINSQIGLVLLGLFVIVVTITGTIMIVKEAKKIKKVKKDNGIPHEKLAIKVLLFNPGMISYIVLCSIIIIMGIISQVTG